MPDLNNVYVKFKILNKFDKLQKLLKNKIDSKVKGELQYNTMPKAMFKLQRNISIILDNIKRQNCYDNYEKYL